MKIGRTSLSKVHDLPISRLNKPRFFGRSSVNNGLVLGGRDKLTRIPTASLDALSYERHGEAIETNRSIPAGCLQTLRTNIDPFSILTSRAFGIKIGEAVLALTAQEVTNCND